MADVFGVARRGTRRANAGSARRRSIQLKLTEEEFALLSALAKQQRVSKQAVLMRAVLTGGPDAAARFERLREELASTRFVLATVANNVNQLAHQANAFALTGGTPVSSKDVAKALAEVKDLVARLDAISGKAER